MGSGLNGGLKAMDKITTVFLEDGGDLSLVIATDHKVELRYPMTTNMKLLWLRKIAESLMEEGWNACGKNTDRDQGRHGDIPANQLRKGRPGVDDDRGSGGGSVR